MSNPQAYVMLMPLPWLFWPACITLTSHHKSCFPLATRSAVRKVKRKKVGNDSPMTTRHKERQEIFQESLVAHEQFAQVTATRDLRPVLKIHLLKAVVRLWYGEKGSSHQHTRPAAVRWTKKRKANFMAPLITGTGLILQPESGLRRWQRGGIAKRKGRSTVVISYLPYGFLCSTALSNCVSSPTEQQCKNKTWASKKDNMSNRMSHCTIKNDTSSNTEV